MRGMPAGRTGAELKVHVIVGIGLPELLQSSTALEPVLAVTLGVSAWITGATRKQTNKIFNDKL